MSTPNYPGPAACVLVCHYVVHFADKRVLEGALKSIKEGDASKLAIKNPASFFAWPVSLPVVGTNDVRPLVEDLVVPVAMTAMSFGCSYWLFCHGECPYNVFA